MPRLNRVHRKGWKLKSIGRFGVSPSTSNLRHLSRAIERTRKSAKNKYNGKSANLAGIKEWR